MQILYKITYLPHLQNNTPPFYYIGSKYNYDGKYMGSLGSEQIDWFTEGKPMFLWWKEKTKNCKDDFKFEILETFENLTKRELVEKEHQLHKQLDVLQEEYFNRAIATLNFCGSGKRTDESRKKTSESTKAFWESEEGKLKKQRLIERNKTTHGAKLKERYKNPTEKMLQYKPTGRKKGAKNKNVYVLSKPKRARSLSTVVIIDNVIYENTAEAAKKLNISYGLVNKRLHSSDYPNWIFLEE